MCNGYWRYTLADASGHRRVVLCAMKRTALECFRRGPLVLLLLLVSRLLTE